MAGKDLRLSGRVAVCVRKSSVRRTLSQVDRFSLQACRPKGTGALYSCSRGVASPLLTENDVRCFQSDHFVSDPEMESC